MKLKLGTVEEEAALCRAAWADTQIGDFALHCHHTLLIEPLTESAESRISWILEHKDVSEQALRLRLFRPLDKKFITAEQQKARADWRKAAAGLQKVEVDLQAVYCSSSHGPYGGPYAFRKVDSDFKKAYADLKKAYADLKKSINKSINHDAVCQPGCPWNGRNIFGDISGIRSSAL